MRRATSNFALHHGRGFTFIELCLGLVVSTLMLSAMAGFTLTMSAHWNSADGTQAGSLSANQTTARVQRKLNNAKRLGFCRAGGPNANKPAALVFWRADDDGDGQMQFLELAVLLYNATDQTIDLYLPELVGKNATNEVWDTAAFTDNSAVNKLTKNQTPTPIASRIAQVTFSTSQTTSTTMLPRFSFALNVANPDGTTSIEYGAATLRSAATPAP